MLLGDWSDRRGQLFLQNLAEELPPAVRLWAVDTAVVVPSRTMKAYAKAYAYRQVCPGTLSATNRRTESFRAVHVVVVEPGVSQHPQCKAVPC